MRPCLAPSPGAPFSPPRSVHAAVGSLSRHRAPSCRAWSRCSCPAGALAPRPSRPSCGAGGGRGARRARGRGISLEARRILRPEMGGSQGEDGRRGPEGSRVTRGQPSSGTARGASGGRSGGARASGAGACGGAAGKFPGRPRGAPFPAATAAQLSERCPGSLPGSGRAARGWSGAGGSGRAGPSPRRRGRRRPGPRGLRRASPPLPPPLMAGT